MLIRAPSDRQALAIDDAAMAPHEAMTTDETQETAALLAPASSTSTTTTKDTTEVFEYTPPQFFGPDSRVPKALQPWLSDLFIFITIHYNFWVFPFLFAFYVLYQRGYGVVVVAILALYAPSFFSGVEKTAKGGAWDFVRTSRLWVLNANFVGIKIIREQDLDAAKRYIFGFHPHGIIILSRIATYGGTWEAVFPKIVTRGTPLAPVCCMRSSARACADSLSSCCLCCSARCVEHLWRPTRARALPLVRLSPLAVLRQRLTRSLGRSSRGSLTHNTL